MHTHAIGPTRSADDTLSISAEAARSPHLLAIRGGAQVAGAAVGQHSEVGRAARQPVAAAGQAAGGRQVLQALVGRHALHFGIAHPAIACGHVSCSLWLEAYRCTALRDVACSSNETRRLHDDGVQSVLAFAQDVEEERWIMHQLAPGGLIHFPLL